MDVEAYLKRIGYRGPLAPSFETLRDIHRAHLFTVPFENLDIHLRRPIVLNDDALFEKIVLKRRGGFCYELNGLFCALLRALGYKVTMLCARVARPEGGYGAPFDHMTLLVQLERRWLADVGFGDSFVEPLALEPDRLQSQWEKTYRIISAREDLLYQSLAEEGVWHPEYLFQLSGYGYRDYEEMCLYHQTSPESSFTRKRVCSRATPEGRITLSGNTLIVTRNGAKERRDLNDEEYQVALKEYFDVVC